MQETFTRDGRRYEWCGGFGAMFKSRERGIKPGDVRMLDGRLFYAFQVRPRGWFRSPEVWWTLPKPTADQLRACKAEMFGVAASAPGGATTETTYG